MVVNEALQGYEIFMFTDNSTAEAAYWKGTSKSRRLFDLVLQLKKLELEQDIILHVIHISGKRMIAEGADGILRGDHSEGVMAGTPITNFVPLHLDPLQRVPALRGWLEKITQGLSFKFLTPDDWYTVGHQLGNFIWTSAPASAEVVVEQLGRARLKRPESFHIIIVPWVMTGRWRRHLTRGTECYLKLDWAEVWDIETQFEPLLMFVCLPYRSHSPKIEAQAKLLDGFRGDLLGAAMRETSDRRKRHILRKFLFQARSLCAL